MGEAKRRREVAATAQRVPVKVYQDGKWLDAIDMVRKTDKSLSAVHAEFFAGVVAGKAAVDCNGCRECCWYDHVAVDVERESPEAVKHLDLVQQEDG